MSAVTESGVPYCPITNMLGEGAFCEVFFTGARTRADMVLGAPGDGWKVATAALGVERGTLLMPQQPGFEREAEHVLALARSRPGAAGLSHRLVDACIAVRLMRVTTLRTIGELVAERAQTILRARGSNVNDYLEECLRELVRQEEESGPDASAAVD